MYSTSSVGLTPRVQVSLRTPAWQGPVPVSWCVPRPKQRQRPSRRVGRVYLPDRARTLYVRVDAYPRLSSAFALLLRTNALLPGSVLVFQLFSQVRVDTYQQSLSLWLTFVRERDFRGSVQLLAWRCPGSAQCPR